MLKVKKLDPRARLPERAYVGDLGYDLFALEDTILKLGEVTKVRTGISVLAFEEIRTVVTRDNNNGGPAEFVRVRHNPLGLLIRDRSSMAAKGIVISGGVLDSGYTGEISVLMTNQNRGLWTQEFEKDGVMLKSNLTCLSDVRAGDDLSKHHAIFGEYLIQAGDKIAQMVPQPVLTGEVVEVEELGESSRGDNGFGSSGQ